MTHMTSENHKKQLDPLGGSHGSAIPYMIGFVISLALTITPYLLVVNKASFKISLLTIVLAFAAVQLIVQGIFFLHIGRGPTPIYNLFFLVSTLGVILLVVVASIWIMNHLNYNMMPGDMSSYIIQDEGISSLNNKSTDICQIVPQNFKLEIVDGQVYPSFVQADRCDSLTIFNKDSTTLNLSLRKVSDPQAKSNYREIDVRAGGNQSISLYQTGDYELVGQNGQVFNIYIAVQPKTTDSNND